MTYTITLENQEPKPVWWTTDPAAAAAAAKVGVVYSAEPVKPVIEEPQEFGSVVRAGFPYQPPGSEHFLWQRSPLNGKHYWESETGAVEVWSELTDVEVLRVGLGELPSESQRAAQDDAYLMGRRDLRDQASKRFIQFASSELTADRQDVWKKAIDVLGGLS